MGRLTLTSFSHKAPGPKGVHYWHATCSCGNSALVRIGSRTSSCGCAAAEWHKSGDARRIHGKTKTPEYRAWCNMRRRCYDQTNTSYPRYGGRGIRVCAEWLDSSEAFLSDMGKRPSPAHSLGRVDNDGDYSPDNCRWETAIEQAANRRAAPRRAPHPNSLAALQRRRRGPTTIRT